MNLPIKVMDAADDARKNYGEMSWFDEKENYELSVLRREFVERASCILIFAVQFLKLPV